jgi:hypothetical protein
MISSGDLGLIKSESLRTKLAVLSDFRDFIIEINKVNLSANMTNTELMEKHVRYHFINPDTDSIKVTTEYDFDAMANDNSFVNKISNQALQWYVVFGKYQNYLGLVDTIKESLEIELKKYDQ